MARYNEILAGRFNRLLQKLLSMKGEVPAPQISSDIQTVLSLDLGVEEGYLGSVERFANSFLQAAVVAQTTGVRIRNPGGSNVVIVIEGVEYYQPSGGAVAEIVVQHGTIGVDLAALLSSTRLDSRGRLRPTAIVSGGNNPASFGGVIHASMPAPTLVLRQVATHDQQITILPGDAVQWLTGDTNVSLRVNLRWRERALEESERT